MEVAPERGPFRCSFVNHHSLTLGLSGTTLLATVERRYRRDPAIEQRLKADVADAQSAVHRAKEAVDSASRVAEEGRGDGEFTGATLEYVECVSRFGSALKRFAEFVLRGSIPTE